MSKDKKATLFIIFASLFIVIITILMYKEKQASLSYNSSDRSGSTEINIYKTRFKNKFRVTESETILKDIVFEKYFQNLRELLEKDNNWKFFKLESEKKVEYVLPPYTKKDFEDPDRLYIDNLYLVAKYTPQGKLLSTRVLYSPDKNLNQIAINMIKKVSPLTMLPRKYNRNIEIEFEFYDSFCYPDIHLNKELLRTIKKGNIKKVKQLLRQGADINTYADLDTGMCKAIDSGNIDMVKFLVNNGYNFISETESSYLSRFEEDYYRAIVKGNFRIYKYLIDYAVKNGFVFGDEVINSLIRSRNIKKIKYFEPIKSPHIVFNEKIKTKKSNRQSSILKDKRFSLSNKDLLEYLKYIRIKIDKHIWNVSDQPYYGRPPVETSILAKINKAGYLVSTKIIESCKKETKDCILDNNAKNYVKKLSPFKRIPNNYPKTFIEVQFDFTYYSDGPTFILADYYINKKFLKAISNNNIKEAKELLSQGADINSEGSECWHSSDAFQHINFYYEYNEDSQKNLKLAAFLFNNGYVFKPEDIPHYNSCGSYESFELFKYLTRKVLETGIDVNALCDDANCYYKLDKTLKALGYKHKKIYKNSYIQKVLSRDIKDFLNATIKDRYSLNKDLKSYYPTYLSANSVCFGGVSDLIVFCFCMFPIESFNISLDFYKSTSKDWEIDKNQLFNILEYHIISILDTNYEGKDSINLDTFWRKESAYKEGKLSSNETNAIRISALTSFFYSRGYFFCMLYLYYTLKVLEFERFNNTVAARLYLKYGPTMQKRYNAYAKNWNKGIIPECPADKYTDRENFISHIDMPFAKSRYKTLPLLNMSFK